MCDVLLAMPDATANGTVVFGKNSDRPVDDCQVVHVSHAGERTGGEIRCSHVSIPESGTVRSTIGCRPYWCWGYETGMNDAGVVGGNTAVFTRELRRDRESKAPGLTGMDLLRLALERGGTAEEAVAVIADLLERHGQWGSGVPGKSHQEGSYDNAFLLADRKEGWVMETAGRRWVAERVTEGVRSISNELTIRHRWTRGSSDIHSHARENGWWDPRWDFDFALVYGDHEHYSRQVSHLRWMRAGDLMQRNAGSIDCATMMSFLRDHYEDSFLDGPQFHPFLPDFHTLCMHASPAAFTWGNTATSVAIELDPRTDAPPAFWAAYLPPCVSVYTAYFLQAPVPASSMDVGTAGLVVRSAPEAPRDHFREESLWWRFRRLADAVAENPLERRQMARERFDLLENRRAGRVAGLVRKASSARASALAALVEEQIAETEEVVAGLEEQWRLNGES